LAQSGHLQNLSSINRGQQARVIAAVSGTVIRRRYEQFARLVEAAQFVQSQRLQRAAMRPREFVADDQGQVERLCDRFDPADQIDAWPDDGEIERSAAPILP